MIREEITTEDINLFRKKIDAVFKVPDEDFNLLAQTLKRVAYQKGEVIVRAGSVFRDVYFIEKGSCRLFALEENKEININFFLENDLAADFKSLRFEEPSDYFLVAMEELTVLKTAKKEYYPIIEESDALSRMRTNLIHELYLHELEQNRQFKQFGPDERYQYLLSNRPELIQRIPLFHLSSYIGTSRETLSRIRKRSSE